MPVLRREALVGSYTFTLAETREKVLETQTLTQLNVTLKIDNAKVDLLYEVTRGEAPVFSTGSFGEAVKAYNEIT